MKINEVNNKIIWEKFITKYTPQSLFQAWNWGEVITNFQFSIFNFQFLWRLGIYEKEELIGIAQVVKVSAKRGTFLHIRHGPIFSLWQKKYFIFLLEYLKKLANKENANFIRISPLLDNSTENRQLFHNIGFRDAPIHRMDGEVCWVLDLDKDETILLSNMRKTTRYLIKQAQKQGVEIVKSKNIDDLKEFLRLYRDTAIRHHFVQHQGIEEEFEVLRKDDQVLLFKGYYQKKLLSAALIVFYNHQAIYHHSASIEQKIPVNYLLQWEAIKEAKKRGKAIYNFWGVTPFDKDRHPWRGLSLFKRGFGGREVEYLHTQDYPLSPLYYCTTYMIESLRRIWKGY